MHTRWIVSITAAALVLSGCATKSRYKRPDVAAPQVFRGSDGSSNAASLADLKWFEVFKDQQLQELVRTALTRNYDLRDATVRVEAARAAVGISRSDQMPQVGGTASITRGRFSTSGSFPLPEGFNQNRTYGGFTLNLLSYEVDLWGRMRRATDAARANLLASEENRRTVVTILVSDVASAYFNLLSLDRELDIAKRTLTTRNDSLALIQKRERQGLATRLELRQAEQLVHTAAEAIPSIEQQIQQTENQISLLLGANPEAVPRGRSLTDQEQPPSVPPGLPSALLQRRPDLRAAEQNLVAANATVDVARAEYFPRISLTSFLGTQSDSLTNLFSSRTNIWQLAPQATQPIFTGGRLRANVQYAQAQEQLAVINYQRVVQTAFREVADALVAHQKAHEIRARQDQLVDTLKDRSRLSYLRYRGGVATLLDALDADRDLFAAELGAAQSNRNELLALVQLYRALGGGWQ